MGRPVPAPTTATIQNTIPAPTVMTTVASAAQVGPAYQPYAGPWTPSTGAYAARPAYKAADYMYPYGTMFADPRAIGMYGYPDRSWICEHRAIRIHVLCSSVRRASDVRSRRRHPGTGIRLVGWSNLCCRCHGRHDRRRRSGVSYRRCQFQVNYVVNF